VGSEIKATLIQAQIRDMENGRQPLSPDDIAVTEEMRTQAARERSIAERKVNQTSAEFTGAGFVWSLAGFFNQPSGNNAARLVGEQAEVPTEVGRRVGPIDGNTVCKVVSTGLAGHMALLGVQAARTEVTASIMEVQIAFRDAYLPTALPPSGS